MLLKDILKAKQEGKSVDIDVKGVDLRMVDADRQGFIWRSTDDTLRVQLRMAFDIPSAEGKPLYDNLDVPEVSLSTEPKYDPCREFVPGDKVRMRERDGRHPYCTCMMEHIVPSDAIFTVVKNHDNGFVSVKSDKSTNTHVVGFYFLELVAPFDEISPYVVVELCNGGYAVYEEKEAHEDDELCIFWEGVHPNAKKAAEDEWARLTEEWRRTRPKAAAEAEIDRLNEQYRNEQE